MFYVKFNADLLKLEVPAGIAPAHGGFAVPCLTAWLRHQERAGRIRKNGLGVKRKSDNRCYVDDAALSGSLSVADCMMAKTSRSTVLVSERGVRAVKVYP
jgi:hypothetical protein